MDLQFIDKRAVVTGSTAGIGFAIAQALVKEGASVVINGRTERRVNEAVSKLRASGVRGKVEGVAADVGTVEGTNKIIRCFPDAEILVNNAGIFEVKPFEHIDDDDWKRFFRSQRPEWSKTQPPLPAGNEKAQLGAGCVYFERERVADSG